MALFSSLQLGITSKWLPVVVARTRRLSLGRSRMVRNDPREAREILVIRLDNLGDVVMSTPIFRELKRQCPRAKITVVVRERCREVLENNPFVDQVVTIATDFKSPMYRLRSVFSAYWRYLRGRRFDVVFHPRVGVDVLRESLLVALVNSPISIGYQCGELLTPGFDRTQVLTHALPPPGPKNEVLANAAIVTAFTTLEFSPRTEIFPSRKDYDFADSILGSLPEGTEIAGIGFGAAERKRHWPPTLWARTMGRLSERTPIAFVIYSSREDVEEAKQICASLLPSVPVRLVVGASFLQIAACIEKSALFLGTDSGLAHIAAAMQTPVVVVSPHPKDGDPEHTNSPERFAPFSTNAQVVSPATAFLPCSRGCEAIEPHCICQVTPDKVACAAEELIRRTTQSIPIEAGSIGEHAAAAL